jgi:hypothetical protein
MPCSTSMATHLRFTSTFTSCWPSAECDARALENVFSSEQVCVVRLAAREALIDKLVYIATNLGKGWARRASRRMAGRLWISGSDDGTNVACNSTQEVLRSRWRNARRSNLYLTLPPELGDREQVLAEVRRRVSEVEDTAGYSAPQEWPNCAGAICGAAPVVARFADEPRATTGPSTD